MLDCSSALAPGTAVLLKSRLSRDAKRSRANSNPEQHAENTELRQSRAKRGASKTLLGVTQSESLLMLVRGYQKKMLRLGILCVSGGLLTGGLAAGWSVGIQSELQAIRVSTDLEVRARVAEARLDGLQLQLSGARDEYQHLWKRYLENLEVKTATTAKLETLLDQLSARKQRRPELDVAALRRNLDEFQKYDPAVLSEGCQRLWLKSNLRS
jgi:hypothetical protein